MTMTVKNQMPSLDGIRACAVSLVILAHAGWGNVVPGGLGVTVFFFLSGFLITTLMVDEKNRTGSIHLRLFYVRRLLRLAPPLVIILLLSWLGALVGLCHGQLNGFALTSQIFFFHNYYVLSGGGNFVDGLEVLWSLAVEEQFYLIFPIIFIVGKLASGRLRRLVFALAAIPMWRLVRVYALSGNEFEMYLSTDTRFDSILYGCLLSLMPMALRRALFPNDWRRLVVIGLAMLLLALTLIVRDVEFRSTLRYSMQGLALMPLFHYAVDNPKLMLARPLNWKWMRQIGVYSYTIYLVHFVIIRNIEVPAAFAHHHDLYILLATSSTSLVFAVAIYQLVEKPLQPIRRRLQSVPLSSRGVGDACPISAV